MLLFPLCFAASPASPKSAASTAASKGCSPQAPASKHSSAPQSPPSKGGSPPPQSPTTSKGCSPQSSPPISCVRHGKENKENVRFKSKGDGKLLFILHQYCMLRTCKFHCSLHQIAAITLPPPPQTTAFFVCNLHIDKQEQTAVGLHVLIKMGQMSPDDDSQYDSQLSEFLKLVNA